MSEFCADHSAHERAIGAHDKRLDAHGGDIDELRECVVRLTALQEAHTAWQSDAVERISALEAAPGRRWEAVANYAITGSAGLLLGLLASHLGF